MDEESYRDVDGVRIHRYFREERIRYAIDYKPREGEIITVSYPKSGTNWTLIIIWNIITRAKRLCDDAEFSLMCPYIEMTGAGAVDNPARMGPIMTHLPMRVFRPVKHAKYIYVARNPYDLAVSYYHHSKGFTPKTVAEVSFGKFLYLFLNEKIMYGDYFDHLLPWYERRHDTNVLFITYEQLKSDTKKQVLRIADFLGKTHGAALRQDEGLLNRVLEASNMESMKALLNEKPAQSMKEIAAYVPFEAGKNVLKENVEMHAASAFVRKGFVGDWKNYFTSDQIAEMKAWISKKTKGSDVMTLWKEFDLP